MSVRFTVVDQDRHCGPVELGTTAVSLKEAGQARPDPDKFSATQFLLAPKKVPPPKCCSS